MKSTVIEENYSNEINNYSTDTDTETELEKELNIEKLDCIVYETEQPNQINDDEIEAIFNNVDRDEQERIQKEWLEASEQSNNIKQHSTDFTEQNQWATSRIERLKSSIEVYRKCWEQPSMGYYEDDINSTFNAIEKKIQLGWFTDSQINYFQSLLNNFNSIMKGKREWIEQHSSVNDSSADLIEPPTVERCGKEIHFSENPMGYMMTLMEVNAVGRRRIDDWYKEHIEELKCAINQLDNNDYREYFNEVLREEGF